MSVANNPATKRRWFRFSLRTLLVGTAVLGGVLGLISNELIRIRRHREAVRTVSRLGGKYVPYGKDHCEARGPWWFPGWSGLYVAEEVVWFNSWDNVGLRDDDLRVLSEFPRLKVVEICAPGITDEGLIHLQAARGLRRLLLQETQVTGAGLRQLRHAPIEQLVLGMPTVTDETLECLDSFPYLKKLALYDTSVTDVGLANLRRVSNLEHLYLEKSPISNDSMCHVAQLKNLKVLELRDVRVDDEGISELVGLTELEEVELERLGVTDQSIRGLAKLPQLRRLYITRTLVTDDGLRELQESVGLRLLGVGPNMPDESLKKLQRLMPACKVFDAAGAIRFHGP